MERKYIMKKLLAILLTLVIMCVFVTSCDYLPEGIKSAVDSVVDKVTGNVDNNEDNNEDNSTDDKPEEPAHTHNFENGVCTGCNEKDPNYVPPHEHTFENGVCTGCNEKDPNYVPPHEHSFEVTESTNPGCLTVGHRVYKCECGEQKEEDFGEPLGHSYQTTTVRAASCVRVGTLKHTCSRCGDNYTEEIPAKGHNFEQSYVEASRIVTCSNNFCSYSQMPDGNGKYRDIIVYKYEESDSEAFYAVYDELAAIIAAAELYDAAKHGYAEGTALEAAYLAMEAKYEELYDIVEYIATQQQIAQIEYYMDMESAEKEENLDFISELRTELVSKFYEFSQPIYDSMYREYYYYGMSEEEINAFIFDSNAVANPEYKKLIDRNNEIELEFYDMEDPTTDEKYPELYAEFVSNNKQIALLLGYSNYLEYAYKNVYGRDYSYTDISTVEEYVKGELHSAYMSVNDKFNSLNYTNKDLVEYSSQMTGNFFVDKSGNKTLNDYIDLMSFENGISFSDEFNKLMADGNLFRGQYQGAFVTSLMSLSLPIAYFGPDYSNPFTVSHEFGHYMNEIYNKGEFDQSYDLLEMHSQGNEILYLHFLKGQLTEGGFALCEIIELLNMMSTVMASMAVDSFERAVYLDTYDGSKASVIMADGVITADEYDTLFLSILEDYGMKGEINSKYWRYVTISSPCYYVSYAISAISVLQLYSIAANDGFDVAKNAYLKLFTYTDENPDMTTEEILIYAGMKSFMDKELYEDLEAVMAGI